MIGILGRWLLGGGVSAIGDQLRRAYQAKLDAQNDSERIAADIEIKRLEAELAAHSEAVSIRKATVGQWEMRLIVFMAGFPPAAHFAAVCLDSALPGLFPGWTVHALPPPMDQWQGSIILSLFGLAAVKLGAAAVMRRR